MFVFCCFVFPFQHILEAPMLLFPPLNVLDNFIHKLLCIFCDYLWCVNNQIVCWAGRWVTEQEKKYHIYIIIILSDKKRREIRRKQPGRYRSWSLLPNAVTLTSSPLCIFCAPHSFFYFSMCLYKLDRLSPPLDIQLDTVNCTAFSVRWKMPRRHVSTITGYKVDWIYWTHRSAAAGKSDVLMHHRLIGAFQIAA